MLFNYFILKSNMLKNLVTLVALWKWVSNFLKMKNGSYISGGCVEMFTHFDAARPLFISHLNVFQETWGNSL